MAYANLTPNLQDMFNQINDRLRKLESGPNSAAYTADTASSQATSALIAAQSSYALASNSIIQSTNTILNSSNQLTAINGNGITVYAGTSSTSGARVVFNSSGIAGFNSSGTNTFAIDATNGNVSITGASFTSGTISGGSLNINGNAIINSSGYLTAYGASITGTINATAGYIGGSSTTGFIINSTYLTDNAGTISIVANASSGSASITSTRGAYFKFLALNNATIGSYSLAVQGDTGFYGATTATGNVTAQSYIYNTGAATTTSSANVFMNSSSGLIARVTSSERYKVEITPEAIPAQSVMALIPKSYVDKAEYEANNNSDSGLPRYLGLIAEDLAQLPVLKDLLVNYNEQGQPDSVNYDRIAIALVPLLQDHEARLAKLEGK